jgi:hypothetical protein
MIIDIYRSDTDICSKRKQSSRATSTKERRYLIDCHHFLDDGVIFGAARGCSWIFGGFVVLRCSIRRSPPNSSSSSSPDCPVLACLYYMAAVQG